MTAVPGTAPAGRGPEPEEVQAPDISVRVLAPLLAYLASQVDRETVDGAVRDAGLEPSQVVDPDAWVSGAFAEAFIRAFVRRTHGLDTSPPRSHPVWQLWRMAGRQTVERRAMGPAWHVVRAFASPAIAFRQFPVLIQRANRMTRAELVSQEPGRTVLRFSPLRPDQPDHVAYCWNRIGTLEDMPTVWDLPRADVAHPECMHDPAQPAGACVYVIHYRERSALPIAVSVGAASLGAVGGWIAASTAAALPAEPLAAALGALLGWTLVLRWRLARAQRAVQVEAERYGQLVAESDARYLRLRRAHLATRKIAGYLPTALVEKLLEDPEQEARLGGRRTDATVLFADIVGFTPRCEGMLPEEVVRQVNLYFSHVDPVVAAHDGIIDKRMGDGIMAVFVGRPGEDPRLGHRSRAVGCALSLLDAADACSAELVATGADPLVIRVGVAAGPLVQGNIGSSVKLEYTVLGDVVNLAARLESNAAPGHVLVERSVADEVGPVGERTREATIQVKGKRRPVQVVELARAARRTATA